MAFAGVLLIRLLSCFPGVVDDDEGRYEMVWIDMQCATVHTLHWLWINFSDDDCVSPL